MFKFNINVSLMVDFHFNWILLLITNYQLPIGSGKAFRGVLDLVGSEALVWDEESDQVNQKSVIWLISLSFQNNGKFWDLLYVICCRQLFWTFFERLNFVIGGIITTPNKTEKKIVSGFDGNNLF
jgi:hypothetical protein